MEKEELKEINKNIEELRRSFVYLSNTIDQKASSQDKIKLTRDMFLVWFSVMSTLSIKILVDWVVNLDPFVELAMIFVISALFIITVFPISYRAFRKIVELSL